MNFSSLDSSWATYSLHFIKYLIISGASKTDFLQHETYKKKLSKRLIQIKVGLICVCVCILCDQWVCVCVSIFGYLICMRVCVWCCVYACMCAVCILCVSVFLMCVCYLDIVTFINSRVSLSVYVYVCVCICVCFCVLCKCVCVCLLM